MEFTIFPKAPDSKGFVRLHFFVSIKNNPGWYPTKVKVLAESWNQEDQIITRAQPEYKKLNGVITKRRGQLQKAFDDLEYERMAPSVELVREKYNASINHEITGAALEVRKKPNIQFFEYWDLYVKERKLTRTKGYLRVFKAPKDWLMEFRPNLRFQDVTSQFYLDFVNYLIEEGELQNNTISTYTAKLVSVMGAALIDPRTKHQNIPIDFKLFDDMYVKPKVFWLDWETEISLIEKFEPLDYDLPFKQALLFLAYTGIRHSDFFAANESTFIRNKGNVYLNFMAVKTKADQNLQLHPKAVEILKAWKFKPPRLYAHDCNEKFKTIAKASGIKGVVEKVRYRGSERLISMVPKPDMITNHTLRRTFGRRWMEKGGDIRLLSKYFGHSSIEQTEDYIGWTTVEMNKEMMRVMG
jgi:integrase